MAGYEIPRRDRRGFLNILFSALGGDGANMTAKLLFKVAVEKLGLDGAYDAKYGSEKTGTATDVSLRLCRPGTPVRESGPTNRPHVLVVFRPELVRPLELNRGLHPDALTIFNTDRPPDAMRDALRLHSGTVICVDAEEIARSSGSRLNMPLAAALAGTLGFPLTQVLEAVARTWPHAAEANGSPRKGCLPARPGRVRGRARRPVEGRLPGRRPLRARRAGGPGRRHQVP